MSTLVASSVLVNNHGWLVVGLALFFVMIVAGALNAAVRVVAMVVQFVRLAVQVALTMAVLAVVLIIIFSRLVH